MITSDPKHIKACMRGINTQSEIYAEWCEASAAVTYKTNEVRAADIVLQAEIMYMFGEVLEADVVKAHDQYWIQYAKEYHWFAKYGKVKPMLRSNTRQLWTPHARKMLI